MNEYCLPMTRSRVTPSKKGSSSGSIIVATSNGGGNAPAGHPQVVTLNTQAIALQGAGQHAQAEALLRQARVQENVHGQGMHLLAVICAQGKRYGESNALWASMLEKNLFTAHVNANYGRSLQLQGQYERALTLLQEAVRLTPQDFTAQLNLAVCLQHV